MEKLNRINIFRYFKYFAIPVLIILVGGSFFLQSKTNQTTKAIDEYMAPCSDVSIVGAPANPSTVRACGRTYTVELLGRWHPFRKVSVKGSVEQSAAS
ncbi:hypothetical protein [Paenibacillus methanolicus]|uniref:Uncharacterized protein n=1 Tax=Paenibacillus methanolicus TaxID=582686 RepID=A0A5S5CJL5_9BACL|nr:hypothetical protein [Paenibacillus methanolicus]TYP79203.1 hypothetical protein BCM02_101321 [Paenibacillus methanolicus]